MAIAEVKHRKLKKWRIKQKAVPTPILENGDRLTREEFERRYESMPHLKKAELIEGRVYMAAAVRRDHAKAHAEIIGWLYQYRIATPGIQLYDNATVRLDETNEPQPDALLRIESKAFHPDWEDEDKYIEHAPEMIVEVAGSSASYDLHDKREAYRRNGVKEYIVWQIYENQLDWFHLVQGQYELLQPDADDILRSTVFPGLWLADDALLAGDVAEVHAVLQQGLQTKEHAAFVNYLRNQD